MEQENRDYFRRDAETLLAAAKSSMRCSTTSNPTTLA
jgi:hypothetical protein